MQRIEDFESMISYDKYKKLRHLIHSKKVSDFNIGWDVQTNRAYFIIAKKIDAMYYVVGGIESILETLQ